MPDNATGTGPANKIPRGNAFRTLGPLIGIPILAALGYNYLSRGNALKTPGMNNIEIAYKRGGATGTHTPGAGTTQRNNHQDSMNVLETDGDGQMKTGAAAKNAQGEKSMGEEQRPVQPTGVGKHFKEATQGTKDGK